MCYIEHRWFSIAAAKNSNCAAATAPRDLCAEESLVHSQRPDQPHEQVGAVRTQTTRRIAFMRRIHQLAHCHSVSETRSSLVQQLSELFHSEALVNRVFRRSTNRVPAVAFDFRHSIGSSAVVQDEFLAE